MNEEAQGVMEEEIMKEENAAPAKNAVLKPEQAQPDQKKRKSVGESARDWFYKLKAPKPISYVILFSFIIIIYTGLLLLSGKQAENTSKTSVSGGIQATPTPTADPQVKAMQDKVNEFTDYVDYINSSTRKFTPPNIDLDINFTGKK